MNKANLFYALVGAIGGLLVAYGYQSMPQGKGESAATDDTSKPLYWVAPMDPNYRRDKPGKSPMGMDLIPVYADEGSKDAPGTVKISPEVENNLGVRIATAKIKALENKINTVGYVKYDEDLITHVHPRVTGWIEKLYVKAEGDPVKKGAPIYQIYSPELVNAQEEFLMAIERGNKRLISAAERRLDSLQVPKSLLKKIRKIKKPVQNVVFYAPRTGVIEKLQIREGFYVKPGTTMMSIVPIDKIWVEAEVFERQLPFLSIESTAEMTLDYFPGKKWSGQVDYIYPTLNAKNRTAKVRFKFDNFEKLLKPNMFAKVELESPKQQLRLTVPIESVIRTGDSSRVVLALGEGKFKSVNVRLGRADTQSIEVLEGISEGDRVVSSAQFLLDSESSKTSDFKRISSEPEASMVHSVWVSATVESAMPSHKMATLTHEAIPDWNWPTMTMDFQFSDKVDMSKLVTGESVEVKIEKGEKNQYLVTEIRIAPVKVKQQQATHEGQSMPMDHSKHQGHSMLMDHSKHQGHSMPMDHSKHQGDSMPMDHSKHQGHSMPMDHSQHQGHSMPMDHSQHQGHSMPMEHSQHQGHSMPMDHSKHQGHSMPNESANGHAEGAHK